MKDDTKDSAALPTGLDEAAEHTAVTTSAKGPGELNFDHLPEDEAEILRRQINVESPNISFFTLYRYSTPIDKIWIVLAFTCAIGSGAALPMYTLIFGNLTDKFAAFYNGSLAPEDFQHEVNSKAIFFLYLGIASIVLNFLETYIIVSVSEVLTARIRRNYLQAILRQNIAYFDKLGAGEVTTRITNDTHSIQLGIAEKSTQIVSGLATFITSFVIGFAKDWKMTFILFSVVVAVLADMIGASYFVMKYTKLANERYSVGSSVAEETLSSIRNTVAFGVQDRLAEKFDVHLIKTKEMSRKQNIARSVLVAFAWGIGYFSYALGFWQGSRFIASGDMTAGTLVTVILAILLGAFVFGNVAPALQNVGIALASGAKIFEAIDRVPPTDSSSTEGLKLDKVEGKIELRNIKFIYPSRPQVTVLPNMNLTINPGETVALVGSSGSGKSTIIGLVERFYDPVKGEVLVDDHNVNDLNLSWLRQQIALVSQEPTLFSTTIEENILYGLVGSPYEDADDETKRNLVVEACKLANAWDFINDLPEGLNTHVGERGFLLSGGQKQRVAIARAIISKPKILLLDEATSALDTKSEGIVQEALDRAAKTRTTIVIAHRLSTIKEADKIVVMSHGEIVEVGTHEELLANEGPYHVLVHAQNLKTSSEHGNDSPSDMASVEHEVPIAFEKNDTAYNVEKIATNKSHHSVSSQIVSKTDNRYTKPDTQRSSFALLVMLFNLNSRKDKIKTLFGVAVTFITGWGYPSLALLFANVMGALSVSPDRYDYMRSRVNLLTGFLFMLGTILLMAYFLMLTLLSQASVNLCRKIRLRVFKHYLRMDIAFFDFEENSSGSLVSTLAQDAESVLGLTGATLCQILQSVTIVFGGLIVGLIFSWRLALVSFSCVPILVCCGFLRFWVITKLAERSKKVYEESGAYACESVGAIRTVAALTREKGVIDVYSKQVDVQVNGSRLAFFRSAVLYGLSEGLVPCIIGLSFWYGSTLMKNYNLSPTGFFVAFFAIIFGSQGAGQAFSYAGDMGKAKQAANNIYNILEVQPSANLTSQEGIRLNDDAVQGEIEFRDVHFRYPTRPQIPVLRGINLSVRKGQYIALVGSSGCGKSTTIGLIERFYEPLSGSVLLDGQDISSINIQEYRNQIALVQQEPTLYSGTIRDNILYGLKVTPEEEEAIALEELKGGENNKDTSSLSPDSFAINEETESIMIDAARKANIHDFVMSLPEGYDTFVGSKGAMLSGGQKQRIAIARALVRNPKVLLLDEATSALDSESEKVVQAALDEAAKGRTTIAVAHRLSTIQNADIIYVFEKGRIFESGTHAELLEKKSIYYDLVQMQRLEG